VLGDGYAQLAEIPDDALNGMALHPASETSAPSLLWAQSLLHRRRRVV